MRHRAIVIATGLVVSAVAGAASVPVTRAAPQAAPYDPSLFQELRWRPLGPFHGGPTTAVAGIASQPGVFLIGTADGGVWRTADYGQTWSPTFDRNATGSIGALAIAPSNPSIVYAGAGRTASGLFKSADGGLTWLQIGLPKARHVAQIAVDPRNADRIVVAVGGNAYGPSPDRGIYRSADGGRTLERTLFKDENTGGADVVIAPGDGQAVYAVLRERRLAPWARAPYAGPGTGLHKSIDGGSTWQAAGHGLPDFASDGLTDIAIAVAPSQPRRLFAAVASRARGGLYRSDDAGGTWSLVTGDAPVTAILGETGAIAVDPLNPDVVYVAGRGAWRSTDAGRTFAIWRSARDEDAHARIWISPADSRVIALAGEHGAAITVTGGASWSARDAQATADIGRVTVDQAFPYRICAQTSRGPMCVTSKSDDGRITPRDWRPIGVDPAAAVAPDPVDAEVVFTGSVGRFDRRTGQMQDVSPAVGPGARVRSGAPLVFSATDTRVLYFGANRLWRTNNGGQAWIEASPDLSREIWEPPPAIAPYLAAAGEQPARLGAIATVAVSILDGNLLWAGTDDGAIHVTRDGGKTWTDVTPAALVPWAAVAHLEASHFDVNTAYAAVNARRVGDERPALYRTRDGGRTWKPITTGLSAASAPIGVLREDLHRRGLLFAGAADGVYLSFDDGEQWLSLRLDLPPTPVRDLVIKDSDVVVATAGRGVWILDDISPLRQITPDVARAPAFLLQPPPSWRFRSAKLGEARPIDGPGSPNPPAGAAISYLIGPNARGPVVLEITELITGDTVMRASSEDEPDRNGGPRMRLSAEPGLHRFVWNLRTPPPHELWVVPDTYIVRLTAGGRAYRQALVVRMDPRVRVSAADLALQYRLSKTLAARIDTLRNGGFPVQLLATLLAAIQQADARPTAAQEAAVAAAVR